MKHNAIGLGCIARAGKDSAFAILQKYLPVERVAFADELKLACDEICRRHLGISPFTLKDEEKNIIRPILVEFGCAVRKVNKRTWIEKAHNKVMDIVQSGKIAVITDVRFDEGDGDEADYIQKELRGILVNIDRIIKWNGTSPVYLSPVNDVEAYNYPKIKTRADINLSAHDLSELENEILMKLVPLFR